MSLTNPPRSQDLDRLATQLTRFEALFEAVPLAIAMFDGDLRLVRANARYGELTALPATQSFGRAIYDAFPNALADITEQIDAVVSGSAESVTLRMAFRNAGAPKIGRAHV